MAINSRKKGCKAERDVAKALEKWANKKFARTPSSGGLNWKKTNVKGDVVCTTEGHYFPFCIEVKSYKEINLSYLVIGKRDCILYKFWEQCQRESGEAEKTPILFMRFNGMPKDEWMVVISYELYKKICSFTPIWNVSKKCQNHLISTQDGLVVMNSSMLWGVNYKELKNLLKKKKK